MKKPKPKVKKKTVKPKKKKPKKLGTPQFTDIPMGDHPIHEPIDDTIDSPEMKSQYESNEQLDEEF